MVRRRNDGSLVLSVAPFGRIVLAAMGAALLVIMLVVGQVSWVALVIALLGLVGLLYDDSWRFVPGEAAAYHRRGVPGILHVRRYPPEQIDRLRLRQLGGERARVPFGTIELLLADGSAVKLEIQKRPNDEFARSAELIAAALDVPLVHGR